PLRELKPSGDSLDLELAQELRQPRVTQYRTHRRSPFRGLRSRPIPSSIMITTGGETQIGVRRVDLPRPKSAFESSLLRISLLAVALVRWVLPRAGSAGSLGEHGSVTSRFSEGSP